VAVAPAEDRVDLGKLDGIVDREDILGRHRVDRGHDAARVAQDLEDIGDVVRKQ
jgi:hypothetical protein